jgi:hypothetical protein
VPRATQIELWAHHEELVRQDRLHDLEAAPEEQLLREPAPAGTDDHQGVVGNLVESLREVLLIAEDPPRVADNSSKAVVGDPALELRAAPPGGMSEEDERGSRPVGEMDGAA